MNGNDLELKRENLVKKYARQVTPNKKITPHKLRSTYGTSLYKETGDIYLVADVLGHKDVNTTKKHYAAIDEDRRRQAAGAVKLEMYKKFVINKTERKPYTYAVTEVVKLYKEGSR